MPTSFSTGYRGMVGSALVRAIGGSQIGNSYCPVVTRSTGQAEVDRYIKLECPDIVINAAAKVGGIHANSTYPAEFIHKNLVINSNLIHSSWTHQVSRF